MNKLKKKIKKWSDKISKDYPKFKPIKIKDLKAVGFESKQPIGNGYYITNLVQCTEWVSGEGYDISINTYNEYNKQSDEKFFSLSSNYLDDILTCLDDLGYFND